MTVATCLCSCASREIRAIPRILKVGNTLHGRQRQKLFALLPERFTAMTNRTRAGSSESEKATSGFGIGLNMAQSMVRLFKGRIDVRYSEDTIVFVGTTVGRRCCVSNNTADGEPVRRSPSCRALRWIRSLSASPPAPSHGPRYSLTRWPASSSPPALSICAPTT